jgi:DNA-binding LacI/PurR family transcriptional regulator
MATIVDISRETGLARTTVAEVLRGKAGYSQASRDRVAAAARRLGYRPNYLSKALNGGKSMSIGTIWPMRGITGDVDVSMRVMEQARRRGYTIYQDEENHHDVSLIRRILRGYADRRVDAVLLWCDRSLLLQLSEDLKPFRGVVAVTADPADHLEHDLVVHDRYQAIEEVVAHLAGSGRRRAAIVLPDDPTQRNKINYFLRCCEARGMRSDPRSIVDLRPFKSVSPFVNGCLEAYASHFREGIDVDALLCGADHSAMAAMRFFQDRAVRVPEDVAVIGWNNLELGALWRPALASIDRAHEQLIQTIGHLLFSRLDHPDLPPRRQTVPMRFTWRESAGGAAGDVTSENHIF